MQQNTIEVNSYERQPRLNSELSSIVSRPLTAENIDSYADEALSELIHLVDTTLTEYTRNPTTVFSSTRENEEAAFSYFGLENIEAVLNHIADKSDETHSLDNFIANITPQDRIIIPPDEVEPQESIGSGEYAEKRTAPRLKTLLFVLANRFSVDIHDQQDLIITKGINSPDMMRSESYYEIKLPRLERHIFINDEIGNATYVFNTAIAESSDAIPDALDDLTKSQITRLLKTHPELGSRLIYGEEYVADLIDAITLPAYNDIGESARVTRKKQEVSFLLPDIEESHLTSQALSRALDVNVRTILRAKEALASELGTITERSTEKRTRLYFSSDQQEMIKQYLESKNVLKESAPEGYITERELTNMLGIALVSVNQAAKENADLLGEVRSFRNDDQSKQRRYFSPAQQRIIIEYLDESGILTPKAPERYLSSAPLAKVLGIAATTIRDYETHVPGLGEVRKYKFRSKIAKGYSPEQQQVLYEYFLRNGYLTEAPAGYVTQSDLVQELQIDHKRFREIYNAVSEEVGEIASYRYKSAGNVRVFSPDQQMTIKRAVERYYAERIPVPEGYVSIRQLRNTLNATVPTIKNVIESLGERLGEIDVYTVNHQLTSAYSPDQQAMIRKYIQQEPGDQ